MISRPVSLAVLLLVWCSSTAAAAPSSPSETYAAYLWKFIHAPRPYRQWPTGLAVALPDVGPKLPGAHKTFTNSVATARPKAVPHGSVIVTEQLGAAGQVSSVLVRFHVSPGFDAPHHDWYWAHFTSDGTLLDSSLDRNSMSKPGFTTLERDGRLWVFKSGSKELLEFRKQGELAKHIVRPGCGPRGMTLKAPDAETLLAYCAARPGFVTRLEQGRLWVFAQGSPELAKFDKEGELAKQVVRPGAGPLGMTLKAPDAATLDQYLLSKPGFTAMIEDGRLWVFRSDSKELTAYRKDKELAKHVVLPGAGPNGITVKGPDRETVISYLAAQEGFDTILTDGRLWIFKSGSKEWTDFKKQHELAKHVVRPGAGPLGVTLKGPDAETLDDYQRATP